MDLVRGCRAGEGSGSSIAVLFWILYFFLAKNDFRCLI